MRLLILLFCTLLQCSSLLAQVYFSQPTSEEVIMGGIPFIVTVYESLTAPYFSQMTDMNLILLSGSNTSPMNLYSWYLNDTNPSTVSNSIIFPPSIGPNASNAYFLGIRGTLKSNTSIYATYYSTRFTLMNMTGTQPLDTYTADQFYTGIAGAPTLLVSCGEPTGASCNPPELKALSTASPSYPTVSAGLGLAAPIVTSPPVGTAYATSTLTASYRTSASAQPTRTATNTPLGSSPTSTTAAPASSSSAASSTTSKMLPAMVYPVIIAGLSLTAACVLFYIYSRYRRSHQHGMTSDCAKIALQRTWWDRMPMPSAMRRSRVVELDAEKAAEIKAVELEGGRTREELGGLEEGTRFELDGGLGNIKKVVEVVVRSERIQMGNGSVEIAKKVEDTRVRHNEPRVSRNEGVVSATKAVILKRDLPPLPTDQGKPGCGKEEMKDCESKREAEAPRKERGHYSVGPDGSYNYR